MDQEIRFCEARDGVRLAWAWHGAGPPMVRTGTWLTHVEFDWGSPAAGHQNREIADALYLALTTVEYHLRHSYRKLGIASRAGLLTALETA